MENLKKIINTFEKCIVLAYFSENLRKPQVNFLHVWTNNTNCCENLRKLWNFWWKFYRKIEFFIVIFFENLLLKIEPLEITPVFYNNFFGFGGGWRIPPVPWLRPWPVQRLKNQNIINESVVQKFLIFSVIFSSHNLYTMNEYLGSILSRAWNLMILCWKFWAFGR